MTANSIGSSMRRKFRRDRPAGHLQRGIKCRLGRGTDRLAHLGNVEPAEQVSEGDSQQLPTAQPTHDRDGRGVVRLAQGGLDHCRVQLVGGSRYQCVVVAEQGERLRRADQHLGHVAAGAQHGGQSRRHGPLVAQQPQVPRRRPQRVGDPPVRPQPGIRLRCLREVAEHDGKQRTLDRGAPRQAACQGADVVQRPARIGEAECRQPAPRLGCGQPQLLGRDVCHRVEQRPVEQLLVQPAHLAGMQRPLGVPDVPRVTPGVGTVAHRPGQHQQLGRIVGNQVRAPQSPQLNAMLGCAQKAVGVAQAQRIVTPHVPAVAQCVQRRQGGGDPQRLVAASVYELQQLDGELDVAQPAALRA